MLSKKFSSIVIPMTLSVFYGKVACSNMCGSAGNSQSPYSDMSRLLQSNSNCVPQQCSPYTPLNYQNNNYGGNNYGGGGNQAPCMPSYYPGSQSGSSTRPGEQQGSPIGNDDECEIATSLTCKKSQGQSTFSYSPSAPSQPQYGGGNQGQGGQGGQQCDCSQQQQSNSGNQNYYQQQQRQPAYNPSYGLQQCDCSQGGSSNGQQQYSGSQNGGSQNRSSTFCPQGSNGSPYGSGSPVSQMMAGYDCNNTTASYKIPTAVIGNTELPLADNVRFLTSSCGSTSPCG